MTALYLIGAAALVFGLGWIVGDGCGYARAWKDALDALSQPFRQDKDEP